MASGIENVLRCFSSVPNKTTATTLSTAKEDIDVKVVELAQRLMLPAIILLLLQDSVVKRRHCEIAD